MAYFNSSNYSPMQNRGKPGYGEIPQSKYNSAALKLMRMNESWTNCRRYWRKGDYQSLNEELKLIWLELQTDSRPDDRKVIMKLKEDYALLLRERKGPSREKKIFDLLEMKWELLFDIEKAQGLGKSYVDPTEDEW